MTLVLAVVCKDSIVMAADSAATFIVNGIKQPTEKIRRLGDIALWGASGHEGMIQDVEAALTKAGNPESYMESAERCRQQIRQVLKPVYQAWKDLQVPLPVHPYNQPCTAHLIFAGFLQQKPCLIEVEPNLAIGQLEDYGHAAIGSAAQFAQARMYPHRRRYPTLDWGKVIAYRTMKEAIDMAVYGVAEPIHLWAMEAPQASGEHPRISQVLGEELRRIEYAMDEWKEGEEECLLLPTTRTPEANELPN